MDVDNSKGREFSRGLAVTLTWPANLHLPGPHFIIDAPTTALSYYHNNLIESKMHAIELAFALECTSSTSQSNLINITTELRPSMSLSDSLEYLQTSDSSSDLTVPIPAQCIAMPHPTTFCPYQQALANSSLATEPANAIRMPYVDSIAHYSHIFITRCG